MSPTPTKARAGLAWAAALAAVMLAFGPATAHATTIGFRSEAEVTAGPGVDVKVTLTHTGDETAENVSVQAELLDRIVNGEAVPSVFPGHNHVWNLHLIDQIPNGIYVIVLRQRYSDANGYPFEVISTAMANVGVKAAPRLFGSLDVGRVPVDGDAKAHLTVKRPEGRSGDADVQLVAPGGLLLSPSALSLHFDSAGKATADFRVRNVKLLAGTSVNIYAFATGTDAGFPQVDAIRGSVAIGPTVLRITSTMFYQAGAAVAGLLVLLEGIFWLRARRGTGE